MDDLFAPKPPPKLGQWPSEQLADYMMGEVHPDQVREPIKSWAAFFVYGAAKQIIAMSAPEKRRDALAKIPHTIRPRVEAEVKRLWANK